jgi:hypothetical protein
MTRRPYGTTLLLVNGIGVLLLRPGCHGRI